MTKDGKTTFFCESCAITCSSEVNLWNHLAGNRHRKRSKGTVTIDWKKKEKLQDFLDNSIKDEPLLGLEYIFEYRNKGDYYYNCRLCNFKLQKKAIMTFHILSARHRRSYVKRCHPDIVLPSMLDKQALNKTFEDLEKKFGRKRIKVFLQKGETPVDEVAVDTSNLGEKSDTPSHEVLELVSSKEPENPEAQKQAVAGSLDQESSSQVAFKENRDFLDYLRNFEIKDDKDVKFIQKIISNCNKVLVKFQEEYVKDKSQTPSEEPPKKRAKTSKAGKQDSSISVAHSSVPKKTTCTVAPVTPPIESAATELFFSSIKSMDASEVSGVLQDIVTTNPAFKGIDVPSLIKYLRETGKLKES